MAASFVREPGGIRIPNLLIRSQVLYPVKLRVRVHIAIKASAKIINKFKI